MLKKIISGGQSGADRGGLEAAKKLGIPTGGYCPKGWLTENGPDYSLKEFGLKEMETAVYDKRTIKNVTESDGTIIFCNLDSKGRIKSHGSALTHRATLELKKPVLINPDMEKFSEWLKINKIKILNIAGSRESEAPGIQKKVKDFLVQSLSNNI